MRLKVICLNVWLGGELFDEVVDFLKNEDADILMLQEVFNGDESFKKIQHRTLNELKTMLDYKYYHFAATFTEIAEGKELVQGNAILSKSPLEEKSVTFYDVLFGKRDPDDETMYHLTPRSLQHVTTSVEGKQIHVLNTQGIWGEHGGDTPRRLEMADHILSEVANNTPLILAGDLNVHEKTETIKKLETKMKSVFMDDMITSFNLKRKDLVKGPGYSTSVVDMMFITPNISIISKKIPNIDVSDHLPLVAILEI